jgi:hypothetical protein
MHAGFVEVRWCVQAREQLIMTLLELLAGKGATPEAVEASIRQMVQDETTRLLTAAQSGEQTALDREAVIIDHVIDRLKLEVVPAITQTLIPAINQVATERETQLLDRLETILQTYRFGFVKTTPGS